MLNTVCHIFTVYIMSIFVNIYSHIIAFVEQNEVYHKQELDIARTEWTRLAKKNT